MRIWILALILTAAESGFAACAASWTGATSNEWDVAGNWASCIPGFAVTNADSATLSVNMNTSISLDTPAITPGLSTLIFNPTGTAFTISSTAGNFIQLNGATSTLQVLSGSNTLQSTPASNPIVKLNGTTLNLTMTSGMITLLAPITDSGLGASSIVMSGPSGTLLSQGNSSITTQKINITGNYTQNSGSLTNQNTASIAAINAGVSFTSNNLSINGGTFTNNNTGTAISNGQNGALVSLSSGTLTVDGGTLINSNAGSTVSTTANLQQTSGSQIIPGTLQLTSGMIVNTNSGDVTDSGPNNTSTFALGAFINIIGNMQMDGGTFQNLNSGTVTSTPGDTQGALLFSETGNIVINHGTFENINTGTVSGSTSPAGAGIGASVGAQIGSFTFNDGTLTNINSGSATGDSAAADIECSLNLTINGGTVTNMNTSDAVASSGAVLNGHTNVILSGGNVINSNSGAVSGTGALITTDVPGTTTISGASVTNVNTGAATGLGAALITGSLTINSGTITNANTAAIPLGGVGSAIATDLGDLVMTGGTLVNNGPLSNIAIAGVGNLIQVSGVSTISGGTVINNDIYLGPSLTLNHPGVISGTGVFADIADNGTMTFSNSGTVIPGGSTAGGNGGTLMLQGSYTQTSSGTFAVNLGDNVPSSEFIITTSTAGFGTAALDGTLVVALAPGGVIVPTDIFTVLTTSNGLTGTFSNVVNTLINLIPVVTYDPATKVLISFQPTISTTTFPTRTQLSVISALNTKITYLVTNRLANLLCGSFPIACEEEEPCNPKPTTSASPSRSSSRELDHPAQIYFAPTGTKGNVLTQKGVVGYRYWDVGGILGFDYSFCDFGIGIVADYLYTHGRAKHHGDKFHVNQLDFSAYSAYSPPSLPDFAINAIAGGGVDWYTFCRHTGSSGTLITRGSPRGFETNALLGAQYTVETPIGNGTFQFIPELDGRFFYIYIDRYHEHGAGSFDLKFQQQILRSLRLNAGARFNFFWCCRHVDMKFDIDLNYQREFLGRHLKARFAPIEIPGPFMSTSSIALGRNFFVGSFDFTMLFSQKYSLDFNYILEWNRIFHDHNFTLTADFRF